MPYQIKYPEFIIDETSGNRVKNRDYEVAGATVTDYTEYLMGQSRLTAILTPRGLPSP